MHNAHELSRAPGLGCPPFARRYSGDRFCFLFLGVLRWFTSPRWLRIPYLIQGWMAGVHSGRVAPLGDPRVKARLRLTEAYRS
jgi:hypothetical protein